MPRVDRRSVERRLRRVGRRLEPLGDPLALDEVAAVAVLLASDAGAGITGGTISIDGGTATY